PSMRSMARCVLPVLVGPSTAVTLRMRLARSRLIATVLKRDVVAEALQSGAARSRGEGKKTALVVRALYGHRRFERHGLCAVGWSGLRLQSMEQRDLRLAARGDLHALGEDRGGACHGRNAHLVGDEHVGAGHRAQRNLDLVAGGHEIRIA